MVKKKMVSVFISSSSSDNKFKTDLCETLRALDVIPIFAKGTYLETGDEIGSSIQRKIEKADFVVADVSGKNPNVMYELGYADASRKPVLLIVSVDSAGLPQSMSGEYYLVYDPQNKAAFKREVRSWISHFVAR
jgi:nucleoside 2-deoxyribosyltransferase